MAEPLLKPVCKSRAAAVYQAMILLAMVVLAFLIYSNTLRSPFYFDGVRHIEDNPHIRLTKLNLSDIITAGFKSRAPTRPIANISFVLNYYFGRYNVIGYHIVNIIIHSLTAIFLFLFIKNTLCTPSLRCKYDRNIWLPAFAALVWLSHPIQTQAVTYIVQRMTSMAAMFYILSFLLYVKGRLAHLEQKKSRLWFTGSILAALMAFGSKQISATLPAFVFLYEWYFFQDLNRQWLRRRLPYIAAVIFIILFLGLWYLGLNPVKRILSSYHGWEFTPTDRMLTQLRIVVYYISLLLLPYPGRLNLDYDFTISRSLVEPATTLICMVLIVWLIGMAVYMARKERLLSFCLLWFFGNLVMESSFLGLELVFEHRLYLPSMLASLAVVLLVYRLIRQNRVKVIIFSILILLFSIWTYQRNKVWSDPVTLWRDCVSKSPNKPRPHNNLGLALQARGELDEAIEQYRQAIQIAPGYVKSYVNLGAALQLQGRLDEALGYLQKVQQIEPQNTEAHYNLAFILQSQGNYDRAAYHYQQTLQTKADYPEAHYNLAIVLAAQGKLNEAISHYRQAIKFKPDYFEAYNNLGLALKTQGRLDEAIEHFRQALKIKSDSPEALYNLSLTLQQQGKLNEAISCLHRSLQVNPDYVASLNNLAWILATHPDPKFQDSNSAIAFAEHAAELTNYKDTFVLNTLAAGYASAGRFDRAIAAAQKALESAINSQNQELAEYIRNQIEIYEQGRNKVKPKTTP